jgi:hypothetical protein
MTNIANLPVPAPAAVPHRTSGNAVQAIIPRTYQDVAGMAQAVCRAGLARKFDNDQSKVAAIMMSGMEVGLKPMASLRLFYTTQEGQPALLARGMLAVVQGSGLLEAWEDRIEGEGEDRRAVVVAKRRGLAPITRSFGWRDMRAAGLGNRANYGKFFDRMIWNRAVSYALNDMFADLLGGLYDPSELGGPVIDEAGQVLLPPAPEPASTAPKESQPKPPLEVNIGDGWEPAKFPRGKKGLREALAFMTGAVLDGKPEVIALNCELLDQIATHIPELAEEISELRSAAAEAMAPKDDPLDPDDLDEFGLPPVRALGQAELGPKGDTTDLPTDPPD